MSQPRRLLTPVPIVLAGAATFAGATVFLNRNQECPPPVLSPAEAAPPDAAGPPVQVRMIEAEFGIDLSPQQPPGRKEWRPWREDPGVLVCPVGPE
jgi:hypothetical protein